MSMFYNFAERIDRIEEIGDRFVRPKTAAVARILSGIGSIIDVGLKSWINCGSGEIKPITNLDVDPSTNVQLAFGVGILAVAAITAVELKTNIDLNPLAVSLNVVSNMS